jgi:hypothetical protein
MSVPQTIAHYKISDTLGECRMSEVSRAADTKLNRDEYLWIVVFGYARPCLAAIPTCG